MRSSEAAVEQKGREERGGEARRQGLVMRRWAASVDLVVSRRGLDGDSGDPVRFATGSLCAWKMPFPATCPVYSRSGSPPAPPSFVPCPPIGSFPAPAPRSSRGHRPPSSSFPSSSPTPLFPPSSSSSSTAARHPSSGPLCFLPGLLFSGCSQTRLPHPRALLTSHEPETSGLDVLTIAK